MSTINFTIDTQPLAQELGNISNQVNATTTAVTAMQTAVVQAEKKSADQVCDNFNKGLFMLIRSQVSQKIAQLQSEIDSNLLQLKHLQKLLSDIKGRMERDYNMISNRYLNLFNGLNMNLKHRFFELDKPAIDFAVREVEKVSNRTKHLTATVPVTQLESLSVSQKIVVSNLKYRGTNAIRSMTKFLSDMYAQKKLTKRNLLSSDPKFNNSGMSLPILICEYNFDRFDNKNMDVTIQTAELSALTQATIKNEALAALDNMKWQNETEINRDIKSEFGKLLSAANTSQRVKDLANRLFLTNIYQTL